VSVSAYRTRTIVSPTVDPMLEPRTPGAEGRVLSPPCLHE
jgi:hypothetical protein